VTGRRDKTAAMSKAQVHPTAVLEGDVTLGEGCVVEAFCYLRGPLEIGANTRISPHCSIGTEGEHRSRGSEGVVRIGANNILREYVMITRGTGDRDTQIGDGCYIMGHSHICHDVILEDHVTMAPGVVLAGHVHVHRNANLGVGAKAHQFSTVGAYAMVGMGAVITCDVPPFALVTGSPARFRRFNTHAFAAAGLTAADLVIEEGALTSAHAGARALIEHFAADSRRKKLLLVVPAH
jgi:UDP-N-acetylglucosamine acyltransferase